MIALRQRHRIVIMIQICHEEWTAELLRDRSRVLLLTFRTTMCSLRQHIDCFQEGRDTKPICESLYLTFLLGLKQIFCPHWFIQSKKFFIVFSSSPCPHIVIAWGLHIPVLTVRKTTPRFTLPGIQSIMIDKDKYTGLLSIEISVSLWESPEKTVTWQVYHQFQKSFET